MTRLRMLYRTMVVLWAALLIYLGYKWTGLLNRRSSPEAARARSSRQHRSSAQRFLRLATRLQGLLIKAGQLVGARADLFPEEYVKVLSVLQDEVPPRPFARVRPVIEAELGRPLGELFAELEPTPVASASLAQVHRGVLRNGTVVAVKVQYPDIERTVEVDLRNIAILARWFRRLVLRDFAIDSLVDELRTTVRLELDFRQEARNAEELARRFQRVPHILVPRMYREHTSRRLLLMEYIEGVKITDPQAVAVAGGSAEKILLLILDAYLQQILLNGFFHADPHPGNLLVQPGPRVVLLDFGMVRRLSPEFLRAFVRLTWATTMGDGGAIADALVGLGFRTRNGDPAVLQAVGETVTRSMSDVESDARDLTRRMNQEMFTILRANPLVQVPQEFLLLSRALGLLNGLGAQLGVRVDVSYWMALYAAQAEAYLSRPPKAPSPS